MSKTTKTVSIGPIVAKASSMRAAEEMALSLASECLNAMDKARPFLVHAAGRFSLVYPMLVDRQLQWAYTNPRSVSEFSPHATDALGYTGWSGMYENHLDARSAAISHCLCYDGPVVPESEWPSGMNHGDADRLRTLLAHQSAAVAA